MFDRAAGSERSTADKEAYPFVQAYLDRLLDTARIGLEAEHAKTRVAMKALEQIREEVILRHGMAMKFRYLRNLAWFALAGGVIGVLLILLGSGNWFIEWTRDCLREPGLAEALPGYGRVTIGAMIGAWLSVAAARSTLAFNEMPDFVSSFREPSVRMLFVGVLARVLALFVQVDIISFDLGNLKLENFRTEPGAALLIGLIAGVAEKAISLRIIERIRKSVPTGTA